MDRDPRQLNPQNMGTKPGGSEDTEEKLEHLSTADSNALLPVLMDFRGLFVNTGGRDSVYERRTA